MLLKPFKLEEYYTKYEFTTKYMLSSSDAQSWSLDQLLSMATPQERSLWDKQWLGYTETKGLPVLRETIAKQLYPGLTADNIICFSGAQEGIFCSLLTLCTPQDHVIVLTPCYQSLLEIPTFVGCEITALELKEEHEWRIDIGAIKKALKPNTKCVVMNFPHNPTGQVILLKELTELITLLDHHGIWLFSDEVYHLLGHPKEGWAPPAACMYPKGISLGVMSKSFGMPGLRIGWIACQDKEIFQNIVQTRYYTTICNSGPSEKLSIIALRNKDIILQRNNAIVASNLALLDMFFAKYADLFSWVHPQGGCTGFVRYKGTEPVDDFCISLATQADTMLLPDSVYNMNSNYFRIGFGRENMPEALAHLEQFIAYERKSARYTL